MRAMFVVKVVGVALVSLILLDEDNLAPGSMLCVALLFLSTIFYGRSIKLAKPNKKNYKFIGKKIKYIIFHYCCYFITLAIASLIILDIIHFNAHNPTMETDFTKMPEPLILGPGPQQFNMPPPMPNSPLPHPQRVTINNVQSFPSHSPNNFFDDLVTISLQGHQGNDQGANIELIGTNSKDFVVSQAFGNDQISIEQQIDDDLAYLLAMFNENIDIPENIEHDEDFLTSLWNKDTTIEEDLSLEEFAKINQDNNHRNLREMDERKQHKMNKKQHKKNKKLHKKNKKNHNKKHENMHLDHKIDTIVSNVQVEGKTKRNI